MPRPLTSSDFRSIRWHLDPEDFALFEGKDPAAADLIDEETWHGIQMLPEDVSIRTSSHYGTELKAMHTIWSAWLEAVGEPVDDLQRADCIYLSALDAADDIRAATFAALHGYYRVAAASLRSVIEWIVVGAYCQLLPGRARYDTWRAGDEPISFREAADALISAPEVQALESHLNQYLGTSMLAQRSPGDEGGYARQLYWDLSNYSHARPGYTSFDLWSSTGPVFDSSSFITIYHYHLDVSFLCFCLIKLARPSFDFPHQAQSLLSAPSFRIEPVAGASITFLFPSTNEGA
jgi:hypothetical protein